MRFKQLTELINTQFQKMCERTLFQSSINGDDLWNIYLSNFREGDDPIFRDPNSSTHNGNNDKSFIRRYGTVVTLDDNLNIVTMFDIDLEESNPYYAPLKAMSKALKQSKIENLFVETFDFLNKTNYEKCKRNNQVFRLGLRSNLKLYTREEVQKFGVVEEGKVYEFFHFSVDLPRTFVDFSGKSQEALMGVRRDNMNVLYRGMREIPLDTLLLVKDLIKQGSLLDGQTHLYKVENFITLKKEYDKATNKENWCWINSADASSRFRNELVGVLCTDLAEGVELNKACQDWNKRVDPANYMKVSAPITQRQIDEAKKFVQENGYEESFDRRFATLKDIDINEILHTNTGKEIKTASLFDKVEPTQSTRHKRSQFDTVEEVSIEKFMTDILPSCTSVEAFVENKHRGNFVALTTANNKDSKPIFKWDNNFSWTFNGNLAGKSQIKDAVKERGGNTEAVVRITIHFPKTTDDYDLHCYEPNRNHIYFSNRRITHPSSGNLDLDAQGLDGHFPPKKRVENLTYTDRSKMPRGTYKIEVNNYSKKGFRHPFNIEVEIEGEITLYEFDRSTGDDTVCIGTLNVLNDITFTPNICKVVENQSISKKIWNIPTNEFVKVNLICLSPNHWGNNNVGNKHYLFMLDECKSDMSLRSFHNENLNADLITHKRVMEVLANTCMIEPSDQQLAGLGFNATVKDELILKLKGSFQRVIKVKF